MPISLALWLSSEAVYLELALDPGSWGLMLTRFLLQTVAASLGAVIIRALPSPSPWAQLFAETFPTNQLTISAYSTRTPHGENHRIRFGEGSGGDLRGMPPPPPVVPCVQFRTSCSGLHSNSVVQAYLLNSHSDCSSL